MYRHILLAYDGSREGACALDQGARLAQSLGAEVTLLAVVTGGSGAMIADAVGAGSMMDKEEEIYGEILEEGLNSLTARGLKATGRLARGLPTEEIATAARALGADLIVVGHRHRGPLARWWSRSVSASLLTDTPCSVLVTVER